MFFVVASDLWSAAAQVQLQRAAAATKYLRAHVGNVPPRRPEPSPAPKTGRAGPERWISPLSHDEIMTYAMSRLTTDEHNRYARAGSIDVHQTLANRQTNFNLDENYQNLFRNLDMPSPSEDNLWFVRNKYENDITFKVFVLYFVEKYLRGDINNFWSWERSGLTWFVWQFFQNIAGYSNTGMPKAKRTPSPKAKQPQPEPKAKAKATADETAGIDCCVCLEPIQDLAAQGQTIYRSRCGNGHAILCQDCFDGIGNQYNPHRVENLNKRCPLCRTQPFEVDVFNVSAAPKASAQPKAKAGADIEIVNGAEFNGVYRDTMRNRNDFYFVPGANAAAKNSANPYHQRFFQILINRYFDGDALMVDEIPYWYAAMIELYNRLRSMGIIREI